MKDYIQILRSAINKKIAADATCTQAELAKKLRLSQSQISRILSGAQTSASKLEMIAERLDVTLPDLIEQAKKQPEAQTIADITDDAIVGVNHDATQPVMRNRIHDALQRSYEVNISVIAVALRFTWHFLMREVPEILASFDEEKRVNLEIGMVSPDYLENLHLTTWMDIGKKVKKEIQEYIDHNGAGSKLTVTLFTYTNLPHWHGMLIDSSDLFLGRTRWHQKAGGIWQLSVGQEPYRLYSAEKPGGLERVRMFMSWFEWYRFSSNFEITNRVDESMKDDPEKITSGFTTRA